MTITTNNTREATIGALEGMTLTKWYGRLRFAVVAKLRNKIMANYAKAKTSHRALPLGSRFGFASAVLKPSKFIRMYNNVTTNPNDELVPNWTFVYPT